METILQNEFNKFLNQESSNMEKNYRNGYNKKNVKTEYENVRIDMPRDRISDNDIKYLVGSTSINEEGDIINKHFNECYLITKSINISDIKIQEEEVSEVKYFSKDEVLKRISNNYEGLTVKTGVWNFLQKILEIYI